MDWLLIITALIVIIGLPFLVLWIFEGIIKWNSLYGKEVFHSELLGFRFREKKINSEFNFEQLDKDIWAKITQHSEYKDKDIFKHLHCVLTTDLYGGPDKSIKAIGTAIIKDFFWWKTFSYEKIISMDVEVIREKRLDNKTIAGLFIHEYLHHWLNKHKGDSDGDHGEIIWKIFGV